MQLEVLIGFIVVCGMVYWANQQDQARDFSRAFQLTLYGLAVFTAWIGISILLVGITTLDSAQPGTSASALSEPATLSLGTAVLVAGLCAGIAFLSFRVVASYDLRVAIRDKVIQPIAPASQYNPESPVHTLAILLALFLVANTLANFVLLGGLEGIAEEIQTSDLTLYTLVTNALIYVLLALLGVGLFIRRTLPATLNRLALSRPRARDLVWGIGGGLILFFTQISLVTVWSLIVSPEDLAQQSVATQQIFAAFSGSLLSGFWLALLSSISEEVLFRGALQPIFGMVWTSLFFVVLHAQYTFTPASAIIFVVALGFAWLRQRRNTTTAIIAHFIYNVIPFLLLWIVNLLPTSA